MTKLERRAALAVLGMTAGVIAAGVRLAGKRARYLAEKAAAAFQDDDLTDEGDADPGPEGDSRKISGQHS